jgi:hypothetical protein
VATGQDVRGIAANDQAVFWVDYGTSDALGNYENNGRLLSRSLADGATSVIADSLPGPERVSLSSQYAYLFVDQRSGANMLGVVRVPLGGGAVKPVQSLAADDRYATYQAFASAPGYEYWNWAGAVYRIAEADNATVEPFVGARDILHVFADDTLVYFQDLKGLWTVPLAGGAPTELSSATSPAGSLAIDVQLLNGDYLYGLEYGSHAYLTRMPKLGGAWKRIAATSTAWSQLAVDGDRYFSDKATATKRQIVQGSLTTPTTQTVLASETYGGNAYWTWNAWTLSSVGIFLADPTGLYLTPTASP